MKVYLSLIEAALSGHTDAAWAQERTEAQTRGPENAQFPRNWRYGSYVTCTKNRARIRELEPGLSTGEYSQVP